MSTPTPEGGTVPEAVIAGGERRPGTSGTTGQVVNPADGSVVATIEFAGTADVDAAVRAASAAFGEWSSAPPVERSAALTRLAAVLESKADEYARVESQQTGKPIRLSSEFDVPGSIDNVAFFAGAARHLEGKASAEWDGTHTSIIRREAVGVVGSIAPWNYPLQMAMWKILPAIAAGNTIVLKPAEITPMTSLMLAEDCLAAGIPAGVVNVVVGAGPVAGEALVSHPDVSMVSFTGSTGVGKRVMELATAGIKRVHLELGGKAPFVVFDDADLEAAVHGAVAGSLINTGQDCTAATRAYVQRPLYEAFVAGVADLFAGIRLGDPMDPATDLGPLISARQAERVAGFVDRARGDGAPRGTGGAAPGGGLGAGACRRRHRRHWRSSTWRCSGRGRLLPADPDHRRRAGQRDRPRRGVRPGPRRHSLRHRRRGLGAGERHRLRPGGLSVDEGRLPGAAGPARDPRRVRLG
jgi:betaine-aldehyde dehydrogenase